MNKSKILHPVVIAGIGQLGGVFATGFLRAGYPVYPATPERPLSKIAGRVPDPFLVLLAVPENNIVETIRQVPEIWRDRLGLLQNELLPHVWESEGIVSPTAMAVWFEKKPGRDVKVFQPTRVFGPAAEIVRSALTALDIPCEILPDKHHLLVELVRKNLFVLTINIAGIAIGGTTGALWAHHRELATAVAHDVLTVMERLTDNTFDRDDMMRFLQTILVSVPDHACRGRVAEDRLARILRIARKAGIATPALDGIT
jgi:ketopantoate reductase